MKCLYIDSDVSPGTNFLYACVCEYIYIYIYIYIYTHTHTHKVYSKSTETEAQFTKTEIRDEENIDFLQNNSFGIQHLFH